MCAMPVRLSPPMTPAHHTICQCSFRRLSKQNQRHKCTIAMIGIFPRCDLQSCVTTSNTGRQLIKASPKPIPPFHPRPKMHCANSVVLHVGCKSSEQWGHARGRCKEPYVVEDIRHIQIVKSYTDHCHIQTVLPRLKRTNSKGRRST